MNAVVYSKAVEQKINYLHTNPLNPKWNPAYETQDYKYLTASHYYTGKDELDFLKTI